MPKSRMMKNGNSVSLFVIPSRSRYLKQASKCAETEIINTLSGVCIPD